MQNQNFSFDQSEEPNKHPHIPAPPPKSFWQEHRKFIFGFIATLILTVAVFFAQTATKDFMATILQVERQASFDGATLPVTRVPDWVSLNSADYKLSASVIAADKFIDLPNYDPVIFGTQLANLNWSRTSDRELVNKLVTYAVPYMGSYETGSKEYDGSHLAIDMKLPVGTEIFAIANGEVAKISDRSSGFGKHIVVRHDSVPLLDSNETTTLYSAYAHLSEISVRQGQIVTRGQKIGLSGDTGTSTTPHLHFQIDNESAPWHPWWPFSTAEATAAGYNFFSGISAGLNKDQATKNTVNPMLWVQRYLVSGSAPSDLHASTASSQPATTTDTTTASGQSGDSASTETDLADTSATVPVASVANKTNFFFAGDTFSFVGNSVSVKISALKSDSSKDTSFAPDSTLQLSVSGSANVTPASLSANDFKNGEATVQMSDATAEKVVLAIANSESKFEVSFLDKVEMIAKFGVEVPRPFVAGIDQTVTIEALDANGQPTPNSNIAGTVRLTASTGAGTFTPPTLTANDFKSGVAKVMLNYPVDGGAFTIKAQEGALVGTSRTVHLQIFSDVTATHPNAKAIAYLKEHEIIGGYPDGTFQPGKTVTRIEALKMILLGLEIELTPTADLNFPDTDGDAWYAPFVGRAVLLEIAKGYPDGTFGPGKTVNRAEYLKILLGSAGITAPAITTAPYADVAVDAWFAPFAGYSKAKNILSVAGDNLKGGAGMTRAEVAETIYRLLVLQKTEASAYSEELEL